ncbi:RsmF rRNA methyltransferase first C-terminal domain-containing protein [Anaerobutyricum hallii]|nr:RsmF rRNA methyltransferase first C-terminal domain-containing protein [Anaerobutyricum hallii]
MKKLLKNQKKLKKQQTETLSSVWWEKCKSLSKEQKAAAEDFFAHVNIAYDVGRIDVRGDNLYYLPEPQYDGRGLHFLRNGLFMGEFKRKDLNRLSHLHSYSVHRILIRYLTFQQMMNDYSDIFAAKPLT